MYRKLEIKMTAIFFVRNLSQKIVEHIFKVPKEKLPILNYLSIKNILINGDTFSDIQTLKEFITRIRKNVLVL